MMFTKIVLMAAMTAVPSPETSLELSVTNTSFSGTTIISSAVRTNLTCDPDGGSHPDPESACDLLREVDGDLASHPGGKGPCTKEYNPYAVRLVGTWEGREITYLHTFANRCEMLRQTGSVFSF